jgi:amino acid efflux transporter
LSARKAESGGVYSFARESLGGRAANSVGWLFITWYVTGAPAVSVIAGSYLSYAFPMSRLAIYLVASLLIIGAFLINYRGIIITGKVQVTVIVAIVALLIITVIASAHLISPNNFTPFLPNGFIPVGVAAALIFWSYLGYENVSNVAEEFKNPQRDFHRSILFSVIIISTLYLSVAIATIGTRAYTAGGSIAPFAAMLSNALGEYAAVATAILAVFIIFGTMNAYTTGMSRVVYATAKYRGLPKIFDKIHVGTGVPHRSLMLLSGLSLVSLVAYYFLNFDLEAVLLIPSGAAILVYVAGSICGIKLLKAKKIFPWISLIISLAMMPFVGIYLLASLVVAGLAYLYSRRTRIAQSRVVLARESPVARN